MNGALYVSKLRRGSRALSLAALSVSASLSLSLSLSIYLHLPSLSLPSLSLPSLLFLSGRGAQASAMDIPEEDVERGFEVLPENLM